jgi:hypothetical protein
MRVKERHTSGVIHFHLLVDCKGDVRTGLNFEEIENHKLPRVTRYHSANARLKALWHELRKSLPKYHLGRHELLPIKSNGEGMAKYVGKYVGKGCDYHPLDKGFRSISLSQEWRIATMKIQWHSPGAQLWRAKCAAFAESKGLPNIAAVSLVLGPKWAYVHREQILDTPCSEFPSQAAAALDVQRSVGVFLLKVCRDRLRGLLADRPLSPKLPVNASDDERAAFASALERWEIHLAEVKAAVSHVREAEKSLRRFSRGQDCYIKPAEETSVTGQGVVTDQSVTGLYQSREGQAASPCG